jgi:hypothetical protein
MVLALGRWRRALRYSTTRSADGMSVCRSVRKVSSGAAATATVPATSDSP